MQFLSLWYSAFSLNHSSPCCWIPFALAQRLSLVLQVHSTQGNIWVQFWGWRERNMCYTPANYGNNKGTYTYGILYSCCENLRFMRTAWNVVCLVICSGVWVNFCFFEIFTIFWFIMNIYYFDKSDNHRCLGGSVG